MITKFYFKKGEEVLCISKDKLQNFFTIGKVYKAVADNRLRDDDGDIHYIDPAFAVDRFKYKIEFEVGKWYEIYYPSMNRNYIVKVPEHKGWNSTNYIENERYYEGGIFYYEKQVLREVPIEEIVDYLPVDHPDRIRFKKWGIGTYVVFIKEYGRSVIGDIDKIIEPCSKNILISENERVTTTNPEYVKWFELREDAEKFAKTLKPTTYKLGQYEVIVNIDTVKVGCTTFSMNDVLDLLESFMTISKNCKSVQGSNDYMVINDVTITAPIVEELYAYITKVNKN